MFTHEDYVKAVAGIVAAQLALPKKGQIGPPDSGKDFKAIASIKLAFGAGAPGLRGVTYYNRWQGSGPSEPAPFVEVCAFGKESDLQLAGTTIHELGHVCAPIGAGHGKEWHEACARLGLRHCHAAGHAYRWADFDPALRFALSSLPKPDDGAVIQNLPGFGQAGLPQRLRACPAGIGTRGGKSRGVGSGSRLRLFECECVPPVKARVAREVFAATCDCCSSGFKLIQKGV